MKFYRYITYYFGYKIIHNKLSAIYSFKDIIRFYKNGVLYNEKNAACVSSYKFKHFYLNNINYGGHKNFTKSSWRRFVKLQAFL